MYFAKILQPPVYTGLVSRRIHTVIIFISLLQFTLVNGSDEGVSYLLLVSPVKVVVDWLWSGGVMGFGGFYFLFLYIFILGILIIKGIKLELN